MEGVHSKILVFLVSDFCVYTAIFSPLLFLLLNFIFGSCFLSDALHTIQTGTAIGNNQSKAHRFGRLCVILVVLSFAAQYYVYFHVAHSSWNGECFQCSPVDCTLDLICSGFGFGEVSARWSSWVSCRTEDLVFLSLWFMLLAMYIRVVCSSSCSTNMTETPRARFSFCRYCQVHIEEMDHHCFFLSNCIGAKNKKSFLLLLLLSASELFFFNYWCFPLLFSGKPVHALVFLGLLGSFGAGVVVTILLVFHCFLWKNKKTTKDFIRSCKKRFRKDDKKG